MTIPNPTGQQDTSGEVTFSVLLESALIRKPYRVLMISVNKEINKIPWARITLLDGDAAEQSFNGSSDPRFTPGKTVEIKAGYQSGESTIFKGILLKHGIKARQGRPSVLVLDCKDVAVKMSVGRKNKLFKDKTDDQIIQQMFNDYGLTVQSGTAGGAAAAGGTQTAQNRKIVQFNATDWDFVVSRADINGKLVIMDDGTPNVVAPQVTQGPQAQAFEVRYGANVFELEADEDAFDEYQSAKSVSWDYVQQKVMENQAQTPSAIQEGGADTGNSLAGIIGLANYNLYHAGKVDATELQNWANARLMRSRLARIRGRASIRGNAALKPGSLLQLKGVGSRFAGNVFVSAVRHNLAGGDWKTEVQFGLSPDWFSRVGDFNDTPATGVIPAVNGLQTGIVKQLKDDPDKQFRILVQLPLVDANEGIWARIATLDAGKTRGSFFLPEIGDEVIVGFVNDDPREAVVLGMVHSGKKPAPLQATDENHQKGFFTRDGMKVLFDDEKKNLQIETPAGNKIHLSEENGAILIQDQNGNKIELKDGITADSPKDITIKATGDVNIQGKNVNLKANAALAVQGGSGAELKSGGQTVIKGSMVQIN